MKKKVLKVLLFLLMIIISVIYTYKIRMLVDDELFNYGFAKNILDGLIPYKDFNMIIPPLFAYITAVILKIFGQKLIVYHILTAFIIVGITFISSKKINKMSFVIYLLLLIYPYTGYNMFTLFLFFILLLIIDKKETKDNFYLEPIIISLMILTKHTLGLLVIPNLIYSKRKKKTFLIYVISFLILLLYLLINNSLFQFIDYTILGMFNFADKNGTSINLLFIVELAIIGVLIYNLVKTKKKEYFYCLMYQIVTFPIVNYVHFMISFIPVVYIIILKYKKYFYFKWFVLVIMLSIFSTYNVIFISKNDLAKNYDVNSFMHGRLIAKNSIKSMELVDQYINKYEDYTPFIFSFMAYQIKLDMDYPINKYDLINNGNMGYEGSKKYIKEVDDYCKNNKCIFFVSVHELNSNGFQTNEYIIKYVMNEYKVIYNSSLFNIYINKN